MSDWYKLDENKKIIKCAPGEGINREGWQVARDQTNNGEVSTVFLGLDHSINGGAGLTTKKWTDIPHGPKPKKVIGRWSKQSRYLRTP